MKHVLVLLFIIPLLAFNSNTAAVDIIGKWTGDDQGEIGAIIFEKEGYAFFEIQGHL